MSQHRRKARLNSFTRVVFEGVEGGTLQLEYNNFGEPYREGLRISIDDKDRSISSHATIDSGNLEEFAEVVNRACDVDFKTKDNEPSWRLWSPDPTMGCAKRWVVTYGGMVIGSITRQVDRANNTRREYYRIEDILRSALAQNDFETPDLAACALVDFWENKQMYPELEFEQAESYPGREIAIGRITAMRVCDYRHEWEEFGSSDWLIEEIRTFAPLDLISDKQLNMFYVTEVCPAKDYPWEDPDLRVTQHEFLGTLNAVNPEDPWIDKFQHIWDDRK